VSEPLFTRIAISSFGVLLLLNTMFNWIMCIFTPPGTPPHDGMTTTANKQTRARTRGADRNSNSNHDGSQGIDVVIDSGEHAELLSIEERREQQQRTVVGPICKSCKGYKPARVHHW
jgi:hypothetical protein